MYPFLPKSIPTPLLPLKDAAASASSSTHPPHPSPEKVASEASTTATTSSLYELPDQQYHHLRLEEDRIRLIRSSLSSHRLNKKNSDTKKKRKRETDYSKAPAIPGWRASAPKELNPEQEEDWQEAMVTARGKVERWMENYRLCRQSYWDEQQQTTTKQPPRSSFYLPQDPSEQMRCCQLCVSMPRKDPHWDVHSPKKGRRLLTGDDLMQCLECAFVGCSPQSIARDSRQHMLQHLLTSGHKFGKQQ
jgi:hypothetical protein